jgi:hypothetical protein
MYVRDIQDRLPLNPHGLFEAVPSPRLAEFKMPEPMKETIQ